MSFGADALTVTLGDVSHLGDAARSCSNDAYGSAATPITDTHEKTINAQSLRDSSASAIVNLTGLAIRDRHHQRSKNIFIVEPTGWVSQF
jgi:hypothetical protein